jgi:hypothetical protein
MRRALLRQWPALTRFYGLTPNTMEQFTIDEINEYIGQFSEYSQAQEMDRRRQARGR